jgi:hypothetical protein
MRSSTGIIGCQVGVLWVLYSLDGRAWILAKHGRPPSGLERVKFTPRVAPADLAQFLAVRAAMTEAEGRRVTDAEVFRLAVRSLLASLPAPLRKRLESG